MQHYTTTYIIHHSAWPPPRPPLPPFGGGLVDYVRAVGPGVYVGSGWKEKRAGQPKEFLYFLMIRV